MPLCQVITPVLCPSPFLAFVHSVVHHHPNETGSGFVEVFFGPSPLIWLCLCKPNKPSLTGHDRSSSASVVLSHPPDTDMSYTRLVSLHSLTFYIGILVYLLFPLNHRDVFLLIISEHSKFPVLAFNSGSNYTASCSVPQNHICHGK